MTSQDSRMMQSMGLTAAHLETPADISSQDHKTKKTHTSENTQTSTSSAVPVSSTSLKSTSVTRISSTPKSGSAMATAVTTSSFSEMSSAGLTSSVSVMSSAVSTSSVSMKRDSPIRSQTTETMRPFGLGRGWWLSSSETKEDRPGVAKKVTTEEKEKEFAPDSYHQETASGHKGAEAPPVREKNTCNQILSPGFESEVAPPVTKMKTTVMPHGFEAEVAPPVTKIKTTVLPHGFEAEVAPPVTKVKITMLSHGFEAEVAPPVTKMKTTVLPHGFEAEVAPPVTKMKITVLPPGSGYVAESAPPVTKKETTVLPPGFEAEVAPPVRGINTKVLASDITVTETVTDVHKQTDESPVREKKQVNPAKQTKKNKKQQQTKGKSVGKATLVDDSLSFPDSDHGHNSMDSGSTLSTEFDLQSDPPIDDIYPEENASAMGTTMLGSMTYVAGKDSDEDLERAATVVVLGSSGMNDEVLEMVLESKKTSGGGELRKLERDPEDDNRAVAVFQDPEVARRVLSSQEPLIVFGQTLTVEPLPAPSKIDPFSVVVTGIKPLTHRDSVEMLFESKKRSGGGDIQHLEYDDVNSVAVITFEEEQVVSRVLDRTGILRLEGAELTVHPRIVCQPLADPRVVVLDNIDLETTKYLLELFLENERKSGGGEGEIEDLQYSPGSGTATVTFKDSSVAERVLSKENLQLCGANIIATSPKPP